MSATIKTSSGRVSAAEIRNRRVMFLSSWSGTSAVAVRGSSAMPQMGQKPGWLRTTSGCIGHVYSTSDDGGGAASFRADGCTNASGSSRKRRSHALAQKWYVLPSCVTVATASSGAIVMPHTGSVTVVSTPAVSVMDESLEASRLPRLPEDQL